MVGTPLGFASAFGYESIVHLLLQNTVNHNIQDINGETLLHYATYRNFSLIIELLLQFGCNTDIQIKTGLTAKKPRCRTRS